MISPRDRVRTIGGEFALESPDHSSRPGESVFDWLHLCGGDQGLSLYASGRDALRAWLRTQAASGCDTLVLPAFICNSVLDAAEDTGVQWVLEPLAVGADLEPEAAAITTAAAHHGERGCILAVPLFGWNYSNPCQQAIGDAAAAGAGIAWDITHGLFSSWVTDVRGRRLGSIRKWCGLADGGVSLGASDGEAAPTDPADEFVRLRRVGMTAKVEWLLGVQGRVEADFLAPLQDAEGVLDHRRGVHGISGDSRIALEWIGVDQITLRRRSNAAVLIDALLDFPGVQLLHPNLPPGVCPLGVPVIVADRDGLRRSLAASRVFCPVHWPLSPRIDTAKFADDHRLSTEILTLPCDQRLDRDDMLRLADLIRGFCR